LDPKLGRFISEDPIGFEGGANFYGYVKNNPASYTDPTGLQVFPPGWWDFWRTYWDMHWRRQEGHRRFPGEPNSFMRHCVTACEAARDYGNPTIPRIFGMGNEAQGFLWHDLWNLWSRMTGQTPWAFQFDDLVANEVGFACADRECESCVRCCTVVRPYFGQ